MQDHNNKGEIVPEAILPARGPVLTTLAILMGLTALNDFSKPFSQALAPEGITTGFVFFGQQLTGTANAVVGSLFGLLLAVYAYGVWTLQAWVVPLAGVYALYVLTNLTLFFRHPPPDLEESLVFGLVYISVAVGVSGGGALYLFRHRDRLH